MHFRTSAFIFVASIFAVIGVSNPAFAQSGESQVLIPSNLKLDEEQRKGLQTQITTEVTASLKKCIAKYPSPQYFTEVVAEYELKKSGKLVGGYIGGAAPDPNLYVKSPEERAKLEEAGAFTRRIVRNDRQLERCMKKATGGADSGLDRYSAKISATFSVAWEGKKPTVEAKTFEVAKAE
jgi:hypothetical protein